MNLFDRVLFLSPHRDDETLAAGGVFFSCKTLTIVYFNTIHPLVEDVVYSEEAEKVANKLQCNVEYSKYCNVNKLDTNPIVWYITEIEQWINNYKPTCVMIPARSRNQDHQVVHDAAIVAIRPHDKNWFVPNVWIYEQHEYMTQDFVPNIFVGIDIDKKIELFKLYESQQRAYRKPEHIKALAILRGSQCNKKYAEAFMSIRGVV